MRKLICGQMPYLMAISLATAACGSDDVDSNEEARRAYLALDGSISKSLNLGFQGFNLATSANIDPQMTVGTTAGTLVINGQADQGASDNKGMRLYVAMVDYDDGEIPYNDDGDTIHVIFDTNVEQLMQPYLSLKFANYPAGTMDGTLAGKYMMSQDLVGELTLSLTISGPTMAGTGTEVLRVPGMTTVKGTATNEDGGVYEIDITL